MYGWLCADGTYDMYSWLCGSANLPLVHMTCMADCVLLVMLHITCMTGCSANRLQESTATSVNTGTSSAAGGHYTVICREREH